MSFNLDKTNFNLPYQLKQGRKTMDQLPIFVWEEILLYLNAFDKHNTIMAFAIDRNALGSIVYWKMSLAIDYRFSKDMMRIVLTNFRVLIKELDLTGIYWMSHHYLLTNIFKLITLEHLYLLGTSVVFKSYMELTCFRKLEKLKTIAVVILTNVAKIRSCCFYFETISSAINSKSIFYKPIVQYQVTHDNVQPSLPVMHEDWLASLKEIHDLASFNRLVAQSQREFTILSYKSLLGEYVDDYFSSLKDIKMLVLKKSPLPPGLNHINLKPITHLTRLTALHIDVVSNFGNKFMETILQECPFINRLSIECYTITFPFYQLKYAQHLEHLIVIMKTSILFNMAKFFFDLNQLESLKLQRLCLQFDQAEVQTNGRVHLVNYFKKNPQLVFFLIIGSITNKEISDTKKKLQLFKKHPYQFFSCIHSRVIRAASFYNLVPFVHWDMIDTHYMRAKIYTSINLM